MWDISSGRFILIKLWRPRNADNIDIESIIAHGYAGPRFFPSGGFRWYQHSLHFFLSLLTCWGARSTITEVSLRWNETHEWNNDWGIWVGSLIVFSFLCLLCWESRAWRFWVFDIPIMSTKWTLNCSIDVCSHNRALTGASWFNVKSMIFFLLG